MPAASPSRIVVVTAGLATAGAVLGAATAVVVSALIVFGLGGVAAVTDSLPILTWTARVGAELGLIFVPAIGWLVLRGVAFWRVFAAVGTGAAIGALVGEWARPFNPYSHELPGVLLGGCIGAAAAGAALRMVTRRSASLERAV